MAALVTSAIDIQSAGGKKFAMGNADLTTAGGYVTAASLGMNYIEAVVGVVEYSATGVTYAAKTNSQTGADTKNGDLWLDCSGTATLYFTVMGR